MIGPDRMNAHALECDYSRIFLAIVLERGALKYMPHQAAPLNFVPRPVVTKLENEQLLDYLYQTTTAIVLLLGYYC